MYTVWGMGTWGLMEKTRAGLPIQSNPRAVDVHQDTFCPTPCVCKHWQHLYSTRISKLHNLPPTSNNNNNPLTRTPTHYDSSPPQPAKMLTSSTGMSPRTLLLQGLNFLFIMATAFMMWKGLSVAADSQSPIVVVLSGSMEPAFQRGDLLFLWNRGVDTKIGDVVVYQVEGKDIPIVHRVIKRFGGGE